MLALRDGKTKVGAAERKVQNSHRFELLQVRIGNVLATTDYVRSALQTFTSSLNTVYRGSIVHLILDQDSNRSQHDSMFDKAMSKRLGEHTKMF